MTASPYVNKSKVKLSQIRTELNITQAQMSEILGVNRVNLSKFENGKRPIEWIEKAVKLQKLLKDAGYSLEDLAIPFDETNSEA